MSFIECRKLTRSFHKGDTVITPLKDLDLDIDEGMFLALMGPSGSGKTTLLNLIAGIDSATSGSLTIGGVDVTHMPRSRLASWRADNIGYIFQLYNLVPVLTAYENVELPLLLHNYSKKERHAKVSLALELVGLADRYDTIRGNSAADRNSAWPLRAQSSETRKSSSPTNRPAISTRVPPPRRWRCSSG